jgi:D-alanyl-D-alanine carboxypeptidase
MKLVTSYTALTFLGGERRFTTSIYQIETSTTLLIVGERDPWLTMYRSVSDKYGPAYAPDLIAKAIKQISPEASPKKVEIKFSKLYSSDIEGLKAHFKAKKIKLSFIEVTSEEAKSLATQPIHQIISPSVNAMVSFLIRFSDNRLADRLSVHATLAHGYADTERGRQKTYQDALLSRQIGIDGLKVVDGSGLSKENRVTSRLIVDLLTKIRAVPEFEAIYQGLPKSGKSGTLKTRFKKTAPDAVGLIKAKTGWVNGTVSLAGYITAGEREYAFAVLADRIPRYYSATERARASIDRMVGSLAQAKVIPTSQQEIY